MPALPQEPTETQFFAVAGEPTYTSGGLLPFEKKRKKSLKTGPFQRLTYSLVFKAGVEGLEPPTQWLTATCSAD